MKCELPREKLIGYLYDEVDAAGKAGIESHISTCPACAQALERLGRTRNLMRAWADEVPPASLVFVPEKTPWWKAILPRRTSAGSRRWVAPGVTLGLAAVILVFAVLNFEARYDGEGSLHVKLRLPAVDDLGPSGKRSRNAGHASGVDPGPTSVPGADSGVDRRRAHASTAGTRPYPRTVRPGPGIPAPSRPGARRPGLAGNRGIDGEPLYSYRGPPAPPACDDIRAGGSVHTSHHRMIN